jgi:exopolysaccharide biosynthesis polyprenyl glycosylphosphotransferase
MPMQARSIQADATDAVGSADAAGTRRLAESAKAGAAIAEAGASDLAVAGRPSEAVTDSEACTEAVALRNGAPSRIDVVARAVGEADRGQQTWYVVENGEGRAAGAPQPCSQPWGILLALADVCAMAAAFLLAALSVGVGVGQLVAGYGLRFGLLLAATVGVFLWQGLYRSRVTVRVLDQVPGIFRSLVIAELVCLAMLTLADSNMSRSGLLVRAVLAAIVLIPIMRAPVFMWERWRRRRGALRNILVVGMGAVATEFAAKVDTNPELGMRVVAFADHEAPPAGGALASRGVSEVDDLHTLLSDLDIDQIVVAFGRMTDDDLLDVLRMSGREVQVSIVPRLFDITTGAAQMEQVSRFPMLTMHRTPCRGVGAALKRTFDVVVAAVGLVLLAVPFAITAAAIKLDSPGPVFFGQYRVGRGGRLFRMLKFRTMVRDAEKLRVDLLAESDTDGILFKMKRDPRVTRVGRVLRRHSLDEFPQLWNVLRGEMSLIGPRPPLPEEVKQYPDWFRARLDVRPGITGLWQIAGRSDLDFAETVKLDLFYVEHWSMWLDLKITLQTIGVMIFGRGAY